MLIEYKINQIYGGFSRECVVISDNNANQRKPLIVVLHGAGETHEELLKYTDGKFNEYASKLGYCLVYPRAFRDHWNDGRYGIEEADDIAYIEFIINEVCDREYIDVTKIYLVGFSRGGIFAHTFAATSNLKIKGIAAVSSAVSTKLKKPYHSKDISVLMINGIQDGVINYYGSSKSKTLSAKESLYFWLSMYTDKKIKLIEKVESDDIKYICCCEYPEILLLESKTGKHSWTLKNNFNSIERIMNFFGLL